MESGKVDKYGGGDSEQNCCTCGTGASVLHDIPSCNWGSLCRVCRAYNVRSPYKEMGAHCLCRWSFEGGTGLVVQSRSLEFNVLRYIVPRRKIHWKLTLSNRSRSGVYT